MYYNRPYYELIFLTPEEHLRMHNTGKHLSDETKKKISEANKGHTFYGKHQSDEAKRKISEAAKAMWERRRAAKEQMNK